MKRENIYNWQMAYWILCDLPCCQISDFCNFPLFKAPVITHPLWSKMCFQFIPPEIPLLLTDAIMRMNSTAVIQAPGRYRWLSARLQYLQCGKLNFWSTRPKTDVSWMFYTKFHSARPTFYLPSSRFICIGEQASFNFPHCSSIANSQLKLLQTCTKSSISWLILSLHPANERRCYKVMTSLIGWVQT